MVSVKPALANFADSSITVKAQPGGILADNTSYKVSPRTFMLSPYNTAVTLMLAANLSRRGIVFFSNIVETLVIIDSNRTADLKTSAIPLKNPYHTL